MWKRITAEISTGGKWDSERMASAVRRKSRKREYKARGSILTDRVSRAYSVKVDCRKGDGVVQ